MTKKTSSYAQSGVDYSVMDPIKVLAQKKAAATAGQLRAFGAQEIPASRGESAYVWEEADGYRALVVEGLGTKNLVADAMRAVTGRTYYDQIAQDTVAMIVNDLIVVGALPQVVNAYFAVGDSQWLADEARARDLINGWAAACKKAGAVWGGGETPTLKGIIDPETIDLGGSAVGLIKHKKHLVLGDKLQPGDAIVLVASSGIHANGITMTRHLASGLPQGFATPMPNKQMFGEALLTPTPIYVPLVRECQAADLDIHYMVNITGHGWRKLMRATPAFRYELEALPKPPAEFRFIQQQTGASDEEMYGNFNMGAGFAVMLPQRQASAVVAAAQVCGFTAWEAGSVQKGPKQVHLEPKQITFAGESLGVRS